MSAPEKNDEVVEDAVPVEDAIEDAVEDAVVADAAPATIAVKVYRLGGDATELTVRTDITVGEVLRQSGVNNLEGVEVQMNGEVVTNLQAPLAVAAGSELVTLLYSNKIRGG